MSKKKLPGRGSLFSYYSNLQNRQQRAAEGGGPYAPSVGAGPLTGPFVRNFDVCYRIHSKT